jgi:hypothetical protein
MITLAAIGLKVLFFLAAPTIILALRRARWWAIAISVLLISYALLGLSNYVQYLVELRAAGQCIVEHDGEGAAVICPPIVDGWEARSDTIKRYTMLLYPNFWLVILGVTAYFRQRRIVVGASPPNTSLERTREG